MVNINEEQITRLKTQAEQFGGVDSQQFKEAVNTQYGAGSYDKLVKNVAGSIQSGAIQGNMENANKIVPTQAPIQTPTQPVGTQAQVNTPVLPEPTPTPKVETPTSTQTQKAEAPVVKIESIEQFKQKGANLPNLEQFIEDRYGSTATQEDGGVTSVINGEKFKWTIDSQGNPIKTSMGKVQEDMSAMDNADTLYTSLLAGQVIPETLKTSNNYVKAQNRFNQYNQFKNLNQSQYQQLLAQGKLIPGTQAYNDLMNDPVAKANIIKAQNLNAINQNQKAEEKIASTENNQSDVILSNNPTVAQALEDGTLSVEEYQSLTNTPDITEKSKNVSKLKEEYIKLKSDYDAVEDDVNAELSGKGLSTSYINAKISERRKSLYKGLSLSEQLYSSAMGELTTMKNDATALLNTNLQLYKEQQSRQQQLEDRQYQEDLATRTMQQEYDFTYGDFNSQDPRVRDTAIRNAVAQLYTQYPIPGMEAPAVKEQKVKSLMAQGLTGEQAISQLEQEIRSTNRYKQMIAPEQTSTQDWAKLSDGTLYNQRTGETRSVGATGEGLGDLRSLASQFPGQAWAKNNNPAGITWNANFDAGKGTAALLKEAGINFTKGTSRPASEGGSYVSFDTIEDGLKAQRIIMTQPYGNSTVEQMLGKWVGTGEALNYAKQVAGNAGIDLKTKVSDLSDQEVSQLQMAKIQKESPGLFNILNQQTGTDIGQDIDTKIIQIGKIAYGKTISDAEGKRIETLVNKYPNLSNYEIALAVKGFDVKDKNQLPVAIAYLNTFNRLPDAVKPEGYEQTLSNYINKGDWKGANEYTAKFIERSVKNDTPTEEYISPSAYKTGLNSTNTLIDLISKNKEKIGLVSGNVNNILNKVKDTGDYQKIKTLLQMNQADVRRTFAGSAVTETEMKALEDFIGGKTTMNVDNLLTMLKTVQNKTNDSFFNQRAGYGFDYNKHLGINTQNTGTPTENAYNNANATIKDLRKNYFND